MLLSGSTVVSLGVIFSRWHPREYDWHKVRAHTKNTRSRFQIPCIHRKEPFGHLHTLSDYLGLYLCRVWGKAFVLSNLEAELRQKPKTDAGKTKKVLPGV